MSMTANNHSQKFQNTLKRFQIGMKYGRPIFLSVPSFDCDWYWGFGYLGNSQCHFHLNSLDIMHDKMRNKILFDQLKEYFGNSLTITNDNDLWQFCEIVKTVYTLKNVAEVFYRGSSYYSTNIDAERIKNRDYYSDIVNNLIPMQIESLWKLLDKYRPH